MGHLYLKYVCHTNLTHIHVMTSIVSTLHLSNRLLMCSLAIKALSTLPSSLPPTPLSASTSSPAHKNEINTIRFLTTTIRFLIKNLGWNVQVFTAPMQE